MLISYKETISTHSEWLFFFSLCGLVCLRKEEKKRRSFFLEVCPLLATQTTTHAEDISVSGVHRILYISTHTYIRSHKAHVYILFCCLFYQLKLAELLLSSKIPRKKTNNSNSTKSVFVL